MYCMIERRQAENSEISHGMNQSINDRQSAIGNRHDKILLPYVQVWYNTPLRTALYIQNVVLKH